MRLFVAAFCVAALLPAFVCASPANADFYGAIASEKRSDESVAHAVDYSSKGEAVDAAISECNKRTRGKKCVLRVWFHKQHCAAYVANAKETAHYFGDTKQDAIQKAHDDFPEGRVLDAVCN
jgi:hypothetical protein